MAEPKPQPPSEAELRELVMRAEAVRQQLGALEAQRAYLQDVLAEARRSLETLEHLAGAKDGDEVLLPVGAGTFVAAKLANQGRAIASLGAGVHAELPAGEARDRLRTRVDNVENALTAVNKDVARLGDELARANAVLEDLYGGA